MVVFPNAKINIGLNILRKRKDGYHDLETLFYPIGLKDALEYVVNGKNRLNFNSSGLNLGIDPEQNIVAKAYRMLQEDHQLPGLDIHLHKAIPFGAGLGGGSSDAAFFLKSLNEYLGLNISDEKLKTLTGRLGADCTFFLENRPAMATGTGDKLSAIDLNLKGYHLLLVKPPFGVDTKTAYAGIVPQESAADFKTMILSGVANWEGQIKNDFEPSLFGQFPGLSLLKNSLTAMGASYVSMSGSGSSIYGLFKSKPTVKASDFPLDYFIWQEELT